MMLRTWREWDAMANYDTIDVTASVTTDLSVDATVTTDANYYTALVTVSDMVIDANPSLAPSVINTEATVSDNSFEVDASLATVIATSALPKYPGPYEVTPSQSSQTLATAQKAMTSDVTVMEIPYYETTNEAGGYTVIIG